MKIEKKSKEGEDKQTNRQKQTKDRQTPRNRYTGVNKSLVNVALKKHLVINVITMWVCIDQSQDRNLKNIPQLSYH